MHWIRAAPPVQIQLPENDARLLAKYEYRAKQFDEMIKICCCWIGYDVLLDFIPVVGKIISLCFSLSMYNLACKANLPRALRRRMIYNISVDFVLGIIPVAGIVLTALYRANTKNARMLRRYLYERARLNQQATEAHVPNTDSHLNTSSSPELPVGKTTAVASPSSAKTLPKLPPRPNLRY
ncbi:hypothetical protein BX666DRAFT_1344182 [Dichotomocladium elegans]|nr:hypothetical protein BX666DRAFT_1344182 [Dichotomocladium elegans]